MVYPLGSDQNYSDLNYYFLSVKNYEYLLKYLQIENERSLFNLLKLLLYHEIIIMYSLP